MRTRRSRGIFIISVLLIVVLVAMFVGAAFELSPMGLRRTANQADLMLAQRAARSGMEYALGRLKAEPTWRGGGSTRTVVVNDANLIVVEEQGNVVGLLRSGAQVSQFRLRFNFQDGSGGGDGVDDPASLTFADIPLVCANNLPGGSELQVPKADGSGGSVPASPTVHQRIPAHSVFIACEGRAGDWLQAASAADPNPAHGFGAIASSRIQTVYKVSDIGQMVTPSAASSANSFRVKMVDPSVAPDGSVPEQVELDSSTSGTMGRIRSRENLELSGGDTTNFHSPVAGEYRVMDDTTNYQNTRAKNNVNFEAEDVATDGFYKIGWSEVKKAAAGASNSLPAGVYSVQQNGTLNYYAMSLEDYRVASAGGTLPPADTLNLPSTVQFNWDASPPAGQPKGKFVVTGDTAVVPAGSVSDLAIVPAKGVDAGPGVASGGGPIANGPLLDLLTTPVPGLVHWDGSQWEYSGAAATLFNQMAAYHGFSGTVNLGGGLYLENPTSSTVVVRHISNNPVATNNQIGNRLMGPLRGYIDNGTGASLVVNSLTTLTGMSVAQASSDVFSPSPVADTTEPFDLNVEFRPSGSTAVLSGEGAVTLGARLTGEGGSIATIGDINLVGLGVDFSASTKPREGVSLYSQNDVLISSYDANADRYRDVSLKGVVYCWGDFKASLGNDKREDGTVRPRNQWGAFDLTGSLVAYGTDPDGSAAPDRGQVSIEARRVGLKFDAAYLTNVMLNLPANFKLSRQWWSQS